MRNSIGENEIEEIAIGCLPGLAYQKRRTLLVKNYVTETMGAAIEVMLPTAEKGKAMVPFISNSRIVCIAHFHWPLLYLIIY
jgi:hypothetical protein